MKKSRDLYIFVQDEDAKHYAVSGPVQHDTVIEWLDVEAVARSRGRAISVFDVFEEVLVLHIKEAEDHGFQKVSIEKILTPPKDRTAEVSGPLPGYAANADRTRLVKILCKSGCGRTGRESWAEMSQPYPGSIVLKKASVGDFEAKCLKCGGIARDPYNWRR